MMSTHRERKKTLGFLLAALFLSQSAFATLIVDTGVPTSDSVSSLRNRLENNQWYPQWRAGQFELTDSYSLTGFATWARVSIAGPITWAIYSDSNNLPGSRLWSANSDVMQGNPEPAWVGVDGVAVRLDAGTYWLAIEIPIGATTYLLRPIGNGSFDNSGPPNPLIGEAGTFGIRPWPDIVWDRTGSRYGYRIYGDLLDVSPVAEPGTLALLGFGLAGLGLSRRRKAH